MITAQNVAKSYAERSAVVDLSFEIGSGESMGLLGPNGAGKTTTIKMLIGLLLPDRGSVRVFGEDPAAPQARRAIGIAPQSISLYGPLTARENLHFFGRLYGLRGSTLRRRVDACLELAGLSDRARHRVDTFSGGMQRRLNIAAALVHQPRVLLLDEPTVGVDPQSRNHIFDTIRRLNAEGLTILYTTHYMEEAQRLCRRVAIIDHGRLLALDGVDRLIERHGGESSVKAEIESAPARVDLPGRRPDGGLEFHASRPLDRIAALTDQGVRFASVHIERPNLESVFLALTGRSLRD